MKMSQLILLMGLGLFTVSTFANSGYQQQMDRTAPATSGSYQQQMDRTAPQNENYPQQMDRTSPESEAGRPHVGPDGTEYPSNNNQDDDPN
ncbi:MAG: hypothetical protein V4501_07835 [Pseudomonadota bacterium]